jgi:hypothetical protein
VVRYVRPVCDHRPGKEAISTSPSIQDLIDESDIVLGGDILRLNINLAYRSAREGGAAS